MKKLLCVIFIFCSFFNNSIILVNDKNTENVDDVPYIPGVYAVDISGYLKTHEPEKKTSMPRELTVEIKKKYRLNGSYYWERTYYDKKTGEFVR